MYPQDDLHEIEKEYWGEEPDEDEREKPFCFECYNTGRRCVVHEFDFQ